jgi:hypothetical protein
MSLKNLNELPPGGWCYEQKDNAGKIIKANWTHRHSPFSDFCMEVLRCREANKYDRATLPQVKDDVDEAQCKRLGYDPVFVKKKPVIFTPSRLFSPAHLRERVQAAGNRIGELSNGARILLRWLGTGGKPVEPTLSQARADVCLHVSGGNPCPHNQPGLKPIERIADIVREQTEEKNNLKLSVQGEEGLHTCALCWCALPLKVHVPIDHILSGTPPAMLEKFKREQPKCWIIAELEEQKTNPAKQ